MNDSAIAVLFCRPSAPQAQSDTFDLESHALDELELDSAWIPMEPVVDGEAELALEHIDEEPGRTWLYRGWMLSEGEYTALAEAVEDRGEQLVVTPDEYAQTLYLPNYYPALEGHTAASAWTDEPSIDAAWEAAQRVPRPWFLKDHVKSAKEAWDEACIVGAEASRSDFAATCQALLDARGERFERGFVVRELLPLAELPIEGANGEPLFDEHRLVWWEGELVAQAPYHDHESAPPTERFDFLAAVESPFFTADVARLTDGTWVVIELNDGGVSTFPPLLDPRDVYRHVAGNR
ncbi:MAG: ATP-grasp domain-containing protein [Deltaproteobacteria bacterium]|nr:ATP-grasp domain-containing protein [Deltaproteobacteria bacterium]